MQFVYILFRFNTILFRCDNFEILNFATKPDPCVLFLSDDCWAEPKRDAMVRTNDSPMSEF